MVDTATIPQLDPIPGALTGAEPVETVQDGISYRTTTQAIADLGGGGGGSITIQVTTDNAAPTDIPLQDASIGRVIVEVTTDGSGLEQVLNLPLPPLPIDGFGNAQYSGQETLIVIVDQPDGDDNVTITNDGSQNINLLTPDNTKVIFYPSVSRLYLDYVGSCALLVFCFDVYKFSLGATDNGSETEWVGTPSISSPVDGGNASLNGNNAIVGNGGTASMAGGVAGTAGSAGGDVFLQGGGGGTAGTHGARVWVHGGEAGGVGFGGDIEYIPGTGNGGRDGLYFLRGLPSSDPGEPDALYQIAGALMISL